MWQFHFEVVVAFKRLSARAAGTTTPQCQGVLFTLHNYSREKTQSDTTGRADGGGFTLEVTLDWTLDRQNASCHPITAAARLPPQRTAASDSLTRVYKPPVFVLWSGRSHNRPQLQIKVEYSCTKKGKCFLEMFCFSLSGSNQNCVDYGVDSWWGRRVGELKDSVCKG